MCDVSDGLVADLGHVAELSGVRVDLGKDSLAVPSPLRDVAAALGADPYHWILTGGEDHALVATFPRDAALPLPFEVIGEVAEGAGVTVDGETYADAGGFDHFTG
jgi:thiamine-monophosphate kinase